MDNDQWAEGYESGMEQGYAERDKTAKGAEKQSRSEVLAACIAELKKQRDRQDQFETQEAGYAMAALSVAMDAISKLRPAASDLEALLWEERDKCCKVMCVRCAEGNVALNSMSVWGHHLEKKVNDTTMRSWYEGCEASPIRQLEKARAEGKG